MKDRFGYHSGVLFLVGVAAIILITLLHFFGILRPVEHAAADLTRLPQAFVTAKAQGVRNFFDLITSLRTLERDVVVLEKKIEELQSEITRLKEFEKENAILKNQLGFAERTDYNLLPAFVIGYDVTTVSQVIELDRGSDDGVQKDMPIIISGRMLVGKVFDVSAHTAKVLLIVDSASATNALVQDSRASGIIRGEHGLGLTMDTIPQGEEVKAGNRVITSGLGGIYPKGLLIGEVEEVFANPNELFQTARVKPYIRFKDLEMVFVLRGLDQSNS